MFCLFPIPSPEMPLTVNGSQREHSPILSLHLSTGWPRWPRQANRTDRKITDLGDTLDSGDTDADDPIGPISANFQLKSTWVILGMIILYSSDRLLNSNLLKIVKLMILIRDRIGGGSLWDPCTVSGISGLGMGKKQNNTKHCKFYLKTKHVGNLRSSF